MKGTQTGVLKKKMSEGTKSMLKKPTKNVKAPKVCYQNPGKLKSWKRAHLTGATGAGNSYSQSAVQSGERVEQKHLTSLSPSHSLQHPADASHC